MTNLMKGYAALAGALAFGATAIMLYIPGALIGVGKMYLPPWCIISIAFVLGFTLSGAVMLTIRQQWNELNAVSRRVRH